MLGFKKQHNAINYLERFCTHCPVQELRADADFAFLTFDMQLKKPLGVLDTLWVALDTYQYSLGERSLPNGIKLPNGAEFLLMVTNNIAELYVTEAYDVFGLWHGVSDPQQQYRSVPSVGAPWRLVRWKNNYTQQEVQYVGSLRVNRLGLPPSSMDAVTIINNTITVRLPWTLLNFTDPSKGEVLHDNRGTPERETLVSDGVAFSIVFQNQVQTTQSRFTWPGWNTVEGATEYTKESYHIAKNYLRTMPGGLIARCDTYEIENDVVTTIAASRGVLQNDLSLDGASLEVILLQAPEAGTLVLGKDGGFAFVPEEGQTGEASFNYQLRGGSFISAPATVTLRIAGEAKGSGFAQLYPNPTVQGVTIKASAIVDRVEVYSITGARVRSFNVYAKEKYLPLEGLKPGMYLFRLFSATETLVKKVIIEN